MSFIPYDERLVSPVREMDDKFMKIQALIDAKKEQLAVKQHKLKRIAKQNQFLAAVKDDYAKYHAHMSKQKQEQLQALKVLDAYIQDLTQSGELTTHNIEDAREEQKKILQEMNAIKAHLDEMVS